MATESQRRANHKYRANHYDQIVIQVPKGDRERYQAQAAARGMKSLTAYIINLLEADRSKDNQDCSSESENACQDVH